MTATPQPLRPKTTVAVVATRPLTDAQRDVLDQLYQPILGVTAYTMAVVLWRQVSLTPELRVSLDHSELLTLLNIGMNPLQEARYRLEATGLLQSYQNQPDRLPELIYELKSPVTSDMFFNDDLLSLLLLETVGERQFKRLKTHFLARPLNRSGWQNISRQFLDVFQLDGRLIAEPPKVISTTKQQLAEQEPATSTLPNAITTSTDFDFPLLVEILKRAYVDLDDIQKYRNVILNEHVLYDIDETEMASLIGDATDLATNKLDINRLKTTIASQYRKRSLSKQTATPAEPLAAPKQSTKKSKLTPQEMALVEVANAFTPVTFLSKLHEEKHSDLVSGEQRIVEQLLARGKLPVPVINILIYYILNDRGFSTLLQGPVDTTSNSWAERGVKTAEEAVIQIHEWHLEKAKPTQRKSYNRANGKRRNVKETLPDWAKEGYQPPKQSAQEVSDRNAEFKQRLNRLKQRSKGDD